MHCVGLGGLRDLYVSALLRSLVEHHYYHHHSQLTAVRYHQIPHQHYSSNPHG